MTKAKLLLDTNIVLDCLCKREPFYSDARILMIAGRVGELDLWITSPQVTDLVYIISEGGKKPLIHGALEKIRGMRTFVRVYPVSEKEIDQMLTTSWSDAENSLMFECALNMRADAIVTRNQGDFESSLVPAFNCTQTLRWIERTCGISYEDISLPSTIQ